jgi:hypothetical protein
MTGPDTPELMTVPTVTITPHTVSNGAPLFPVEGQPPSQSPSDPAGVMFPGVPPPVCDDED